MQSNALLLLMALQETGWGRPGSNGATLGLSVELLWGLHFLCFGGISALSISQADLEHPAAGWEDIPKNSALGDLPSPASTQTQLSLLRHAQQMVQGPHILHGVHCTPQCVAVGRGHGLGEEAAHSPGVAFLQPTNICSAWESYGLVTWALLKAGCSCGCRLKWR